MNFYVSIYPTGGNPPLTLNFGPNIGSSLVGQNTFQLTASGGKPPYHFSYTPNATVIPGMRVLDGPPLPTYFPSTVTGGFAGVVTTPGVYTTSIRVTDSAAATFDSPITWTVVDTTILTQNQWPKATRGQPYSFTMTGYGGSGNYSWSASNLPPGLSMSTSGTISGTPTATGSYNPSVTITDLTNNTSAGWGYQLTVDPFAIATGGVLPQGTQGQAYSQTLTAPNCGSGCTWTIAGGSLPNGISLNAGGVLSGTPNGSYNSGFLVQAAGSNGTVQKEFSLLIIASTIQPLSLNMGSQFGFNTVGDTVANALFAQGGTLPYTWTLQSGALPPGVSLAGPGETLGSNQFPGFTYLAGRTMQVGNYSFTLKVTDAVSAAASQTFTWAVSPLQFNITNYPVSGNPLVYNTPFSTQLLVLGGSGTYTSWLVFSGALPPGLTLNATTGVVSGTPTNTGGFNAQIQVTDSLANTKTQNVSFNVASPTGVNLNPGNQSSYTAQLGFTNYYGWGPNGGTPPYTYTALTPLPSGCVLEFGNAISSPNIGNYGMICTPLAAGNFTFTIQMTDSVGNIGVSSITLHVLALTLFSNTNLPNGSVGTPYLQMLQAWDTSPVTWIVAANSALPPGLSISGSSITGTPTAAGKYSFTLTATDAANLPFNFGFNLVISTISITNPEIIPQQVISNVPYSYTMTAAGGGAVKTWSATNLPDGISIGPTTGKLSGTTSNTSGTFRIMVTVTDGASTYTHAFTLFARFGDTLTPNFNILATQMADARVGQSASYSLNAGGGVPPYTWTLASGSILPPGLNLNSGASLSFYSANQTVGVTYLEGSPTTAGVYTFDLIATDSTGATLRRTFTLNVSPIAILTSNLKTATIGVAYAAQLQGVGGTPPYTFTYDSAGIGVDMLPPGFTASASGLISGTTTSTGNFSSYVTVHDSASHTYRFTYSLDVVNASGLEVASTPPAGLQLGVGFSTSLYTSGNSNYTWSVSAGSMPPGLTLGADGTVFGAPSVAGSFNVTVRATDANNPSNYADRAYTAIQVGPAQAITHQISQLPPATAGVAYTYTVNVAGGTPPYTFATLPSSIAPLPPGLTLSSSGVLSGTPTATGRFSVTCLVTDSNSLPTYITIPTLTVLAAGQTNPVVALSQSFPDGSVGTPLAVPIDQLLLYGGVSAFTWTVTAGSSLPPGLTIVPGSSGITSYLAGIPTTAGTYTFSLTVTDAAAQTSTAVVAMNISPISSAPLAQSALNGVVGTLQFVFPTISGGNPPYTFALASWSDMPPGLSFNGVGVSGTPTSPGSFTVTIVVTDSAGHTLNVGFPIVIDRASQAQGLGTSPGAIQFNYTLTAPAPAPISIGVGTTTGTLPFTAIVSGISGATLSASSGTAPTNLNLSLDTGSLAAGTYTGVVAVNAPQAANVNSAIPVILTVVNPPPCIYSLNPTGGSMVAAGGTGSFSVSTGSLCAWTPTPSDSWITLTAGSGPGSGTVSYSVTANTGLSARTGSITVAGQTYTITQFGSSCALAINPATVSVTAAGGQAFVNVTASNEACTWTASGLSASPTNGTGTGTVSLTIPANTSTNSQVLAATLAGQTFTANQSGVNCTVGLSASGYSSGSGGGNGAVNVTTPAGCSYNTVPGPSWITVTSGATGAGPGPVTLNFSVAANSTTSGRSGTLAIGDQLFTVSQDPTPCSVTVDASSLPSPFGSTGGAGTIAINANGSNCSWSASSPTTWATLSTGSGTGSGSVNLTLTSNAASATARSTSLTIAGQTLGVMESGTTCTYSLGSSTASVPNGGGTGAVRVSAPSVCSWSTAQDGSAPWLTVSAGASGTSDVTFTATANISSSPRSGTLTIAGQSYTVAQAAAPCLYTLSSTTTTVAADGASSSFTFSTSATGCSASAQSFSGWLSVTTSSSSDGTSGTVNFTATPNPAGSTRTGTIQFAGNRFTVSQIGAACSYSLNAYGALFARAGGSGSVAGSQSALGCSPTYGTDQPTIVTLGALSGPVLNIFTLPYVVNPFTSVMTTVRLMTISFGGQIYVVKQTSW
jgi:hypothetical protein